MNQSLGKKLLWGERGPWPWPPTAVAPNTCKIYCQQNLNFQAILPQSSLSNTENNHYCGNGRLLPQLVSGTTNVCNANSVTGLSKVNGHPNNGEATQVMETQTMDVYDANSPLLTTGELQILNPGVFRPYGRRRAFNGRVVTVKAFEDNAVVVETVLETSTDRVPPGEGKVLVVDGGGSLRRAMVGSVLAKMAYKMGWVGIVVNGCIRDVDEINTIDIGIWAMGSVPARSSKKGGGEKHVPVQFSGAMIHDGDWLCADSTGILVAKRELSVLGPPHWPVHNMTREGECIYNHVMADYTSPVEPHRLFKAHFLDDHNFLPKFLPESFKSIDFVHGHCTAVGCIKQVNFTRGSVFKYVKNRVDELDVDKLYVKYTSIEGDILKDKWDFIVYDVKIEPSITGSHFKMIGHYHAKREAVTTEEDVIVHLEGMKNTHKAIQEFLLLYLDLYA